MVRAKDIGHREPIIKERKMKFAGFERLGDTAVVVRRQEIRVRSGMAPGADVIRAVLGLQKADQNHFALAFDHQCVSVEVSLSRA